MNLQNKILLITGIDEFIGLRAAELAIAQGMKVRGIQNSQIKDQTAQNLGIEILVGNITDPGICSKACQGIDIVLHTAQIAEEAGDIKHFREINVNGTINIAKAAKQAGVKTFVHLSSTLVYGFDYPERVTESGVLSGENNPYCQTKIEAEIEVLKLNNAPEFGVIVIRAGDVYGPGSIPWIVRPIQMMRQKLFAYANDGKGVMNHLYVDNLIDAIFLAIEKSAYGEIFNITDGQETSWKDYFIHLASLEGLPAPMSLPKEEMKLFLRVRLQGQKLFRKKADILPESVDFMSRPYAYSIAKAQNILNYQAKVDLAQGMGRTREWLQKTDIQKLMK
ncbi:NAD-dependent epimerase/dehydratase family protein [Dolichospermum circinale]|uniref:NAD-dependent epimerase/dehydratase family protein n=1 Tax=Dolichospermum circinale CS-537/01 TaxID=3021739 RepID=A0ABT5A0I7_9CYAN|nr:NAD-dependent epimerase/dehydratase family protein [Dolichospermum circinale]MDB9465745.1 NAD-dependent epimerase/dehydratase family protein [Dolichospermum circinale CS-539/09]MDB9470612.1 NAD-dependent epimerase/dehydratase family protein [Dolichospermum circinale CS-539]MDB9485243.1 NAD-dependent epimerase/dehydratase family protein [Dolichospermum circinale CS-537/01]